jgi:hypothetical protein
VSFLEHDDAFFAKLLQNIDIYVVAAAFQDKVVKPVTPESLATPGDDDPDPFPADFMVKLGRGELKPDDIDVTDEETLDILTKIYLTDELYFNDLVSIMLFDTDLKMRAAEEALDRIHSQVKDIEALTEEAEDMFVPLED